MGKQKRRPPPAPRNVAESILLAAPQVAEQVNARAVILYVDAVEDLRWVRRLARRGRELILVARNREQADRVARLRGRKLLVPPVFRLGRLDQVRLAAMFAYSRHMLRVGDTFVGLAGPGGQVIDSLMVLTLGREWDVFELVEGPSDSARVHQAVFQRVLNLAISLSNEGREGKPVGVLFVIGDADEVMAHSDQLVLNPFHGYAPEDRNILDDSLFETIREFSMLDGAVLIRGDGEIVSAGVYIRPTVPSQNLPQGLGARHATASAITATTPCIAITVSETTGTVRLWRRGQVVLEISRGSVPVLHARVSPPQP